ncbi:MAG: hypothetical protein V3U54_02945 [Thermodesulfobacteriota bacterium]
MRFPTVLISVSGGIYSINSAINGVKVAQNAVSDAGNATKEKEEEKEKEKENIPVGKRRFLNHIFLKDVEHQ